MAGWLAARLPPVSLPALVLLCGCMHSHVNNVLPDLKRVTLNSAHTGECAVQLFAAFYGRAGAVIAPYYIYIAKEADA